MSHSHMDIPLRSVRYFPTFAVCLYLFPVLFSPPHSSSFIQTRTARQHRHMKMSILPQLRSSQVPVHKRPSELRLECVERRQGARTGNFSLYVLLRNGGLGAIVVVVDD